nr:hypothetical protein [Candidatus Njordarchaeum guaymaensis]
MPALIIDDVEVVDNHRVPTFHSITGQDTVSDAQDVLTPITSISEAQLRN